jgi:hypothetical protein
MPTTIELRTPCCNRKVRGAEVTEADDDHAHEVPEVYDGLLHKLIQRTCPKCKLWYRVLFFTYPPDTKYVVKWEDLGVRKKPTEADLELPEPNLGLTIRNLHLARCCRRLGLDELSDSIEKATTPSEWPKLYKVNHPQLEGRRYVGCFQQTCFGMGMDLQDAGMLRKTIFPDNKDDIFKVRHPQFMENGIAAIANGSVIADPDLVEEVNEDYWRN